ncbi:MAG: hypothetical protein J7485_09320 [Sphingobium sp.]|nr:hypothetical protein [Sphingobium sp.]
MGRKSVPFIGESSLLRLRLSDVLGDDHAEFSLIGADEDEDDESGVMASFRPGSPAGVTFEDLYRRNRNRARLIGLLHTHRTCHGAPIVVLAGGTDEDERTLAGRSGCLARATARP